MLLIGLNLLGATDQDDKDFVKVPPEAIALSKRAKIKQTNLEKTTTDLIPESVMECLYQISHNFGVGILTLFEKVFERLEMAIKIMLTAKTINIMNIPH